MRVVVALALLFAHGCVGWCAPPPPEAPLVGLPPPVLEEAPQDTSLPDDALKEAPADVADDAPPPRDPLKRPRPRGDGAAGGGSPPAGKPPAAPPAQAPPAKKKKKTPPAAPKGITRVSERSWTVTERLFSSWKDDPYQLGNAVEKGTGWELKRVRRRQGHHLGMKNNDVVYEVNGKKLNTRAQLLAAYMLLKGKDRFDVLFERDGKRMTHRYEVVSGRGR